MNKQRERLVELLKSFPTIQIAKGAFVESISDELADYLLADGWMRPPCKVGDTVYTIYDKKVYEAVCEYVTTVQHKEGSFTKIKAEFDIEDSFYYDGRKTRFGVYGIYETDVFLAKEEAENALVNYGSSKNDTVRKEGVQG